MIPEPAATPPHGDDSYLCQHDRHQNDDVRVLLLQHQPAGADMGNDLFNKRGFA